MAEKATLVLRLDSEINLALESEARYLKTTKSAFVRNLIKTHLNQSNVVIDSLIEEQTRLTNDMAEIKETIAGLAELVPIIFAMVNVATVDNNNVELREKMKNAAEKGREIMNKVKSTNVNKG